MWTGRWMFSTRILSLFLRFKKCRSMRVSSQEIYKIRFLIIVPAIIFMARRHNFLLLVFAFVQGSSNDFDFWAMPYEKENGLLHHGLWLGVFYNFYVGIRTLSLWCSWSHLLKIMNNGLNLFKQALCLLGNCTFRKIQSENNLQIINLKYLFFKDFPSLWQLYRTRFRNWDKNLCQMFLPQVAKVYF